jgi:hypothetical protein
MLAAFPSKGLKAYGYCELVTKDGKPNPVTCVPDAIKRDRIVASIDDKYNGIFYHRLLSSPFIEDEDFSFGKKMSKRYSARIRTVIALKVQLGEEFIFTFVNAIPDRITTLTDFKFVLLSEGSLIADHEAVYIEEYGNNSYEKHRTTWNVFALEYDIEFILC